MKPVSFLRTAPAAGVIGDEPYVYTHPLSLDTHIIKHPTATYFVRAQYPSERLRDTGIEHNDILVVDRSVEPKEGSITVSTQDGTMELIEWRHVSREKREHTYLGTVTALVRTLYP